MRRFTIDIGCGTLVWGRELTSEEMLEVISAGYKNISAGYKNIYEYNSWQDIAEYHPYIKIIRTIKKH